MHSQCFICPATRSLLEVKGHMYYVSVCFPNILKIPGPFFEMFHTFVHLIYTGFHQPWSKVKVTGKFNYESGVLQITYLPIMPVRASDR